MKNFVSLLSLFLVLISLVGCAKQQIPQNFTTHTTNPKAEETTPSIKNSAEYNPYEEYITSVAKGKYHYTDLNGDNYPELIILRYNGESEILTISEEHKITIIFSGRHIFLCEGNIIGQFSEGSGGMTLIFYKIENNEAVIIDKIMYSYHEDAFYRSTDEQIKTRITEEEANQISKQYALLSDSIPWYLIWFYSK